MKTLTIIRGAPGSSKTTTGEALQEYWHKKKGFLAPKFEADMFMVDSEGKYEFNPARLGECHRKCREGVESAMKLEESQIILSNTSVRIKEFKPYLNLAEKYGYEVVEIICRGDLGNVHGVPQEKVEEMRERFQYY